MAEMKDLSTTDASNNGTAANAGFPEGMPPSDVNNAARALEGMLARWYGDTNGALVSGGTGSAYTLTINRSLTTSYSDGLVVAFQANAASANAATLNVNSKGAKVILKRGTTTVSASDILADQIVLLAYESTNDAWQMLSPAAIGGGDVVGPGSTTDNALPRFDGTGGKTLQGSSVVVDDSNNMSGVANLTATGTPTLGGLAYPTSDGTSGQVLTTNGSGTLSFASFGGSVDATARDRVTQLAFRVASLNSLAVFEMTDMVLDAFEDETGVEVNTDATYDSTNDYYDNPGAFTDGPTATLDTNLSNWSNYTIVQIIDAAEFSNNSSQVRVTFEGGSAEGFRIETAWIGHQGAGDVYDFDGNQVQLQFSGNDHVEIAVSTTATSDAADFDLDASKNLLIAFEIQKQTGTNNDTARALTSKTNWSAYQKVVQNDTGTTDKTGYSAAAYEVIAINKIEVLGAAGNITLISDEYTADAAPDTARATIWLDPVDSVTINTDAIAYASRAGAAFTTDYATDANQIDDVAHGLSDDDRVAVFSTGTLPAGLTEGVLYYVVNSTTDAFELSTSSGGAAVTLTDDGTGTHTWAVFDPVTLVEDVAYDADVTIYAADVDISGQPSGTAMRWAFATANNKEQRLHGFSLSWR